MLPKPEAACFLIADISGYTNFLAAVELDHAQDIVADFMDTVVRGLRPPFRLAKFEGDAAFCYAMADKVDGSLLQDSIESTYFEFRRRMRNVRQASACECEACRTMGALDFKFVVHHGEMVKQKMGGREELAGRDVILVHRLLKNSAGAKVGNHAYVLYSDACIRALGIDAKAQGLIEHRETIDVIGDITTWLRDLEAAWQQETERRRFEVTRDNCYSTWEYDIDAPRATVWEHFTVPGRRPKWQATQKIVETAVNGRRGVGTTNHCMTSSVVEEILDWRPFDYVTTSSLPPVPDAPKMITTYALEERPNGATHIEIRIGKPKPKDRAMVETIVQQYKTVITEAIARLKPMLEGRQASVAVIDEPPLLPSKERFLTEPLKQSR